MTPRESAAADPESIAGLVVAGAPPDTGNMGVSALHDAIVGEVAGRLPGAPISVLDFGRGVRHRDVHGARGAVRVRCVGATYTRRIYRADSYFRIRCEARLGGLRNRAARILLSSTAILDVSGGDSFTDMYGPWRLRSVMQPKEFALEHGVPLVLLPQTYGPFASERSRDVAARAVRRASMAWARDARSFEVLRDLLGDAFDPERHRSGVDVAFLLAPRAPARGLTGELAAWLRQGSAGPLAGVNVSGLLFNDHAAAREQYRLRCDYRELLRQLVLRLLADPGTRVLLVPHVLVAPGHFESDHDACLAIQREVPASQAGRVRVLPPDFGPGELKWIVAHADWFCGTRMHSTIAALSSGVPTAAVSYSPKTLGVFETCGQGRHVADPRTLDTAAALDQLLASWASRDATRADLARRLPETLATAAAQFDAIAGHCRSLVRGAEVRCEGTGCR